MIKSIQTKIILIFFIIGIIIIGALSFLNINSLKQIETANTEINTIIAEKTSQTLLIMAIAIGVFAIITVLVGYFIHKAIVKPIDNLIENAEKIANGEEVEFKEQNKNQTQISELSNAFNLMTNELKQNLNEVARQKRQIETILLQMTLVICFIWIYTIVKQRVEKPSAFYFSVFRARARIVKSGTGLRFAYF